ncbi:MAG: hypothetical protein IIW01_05170, partial [Thermoguttaceae bacterium]|nr:hypothetical protein [Thermoguttaceae bacterium]
AHLGIGIIQAQVLHHLFLHLPGFKYLGVVRGQVGTDLQVGQVDRFNPSKFPPALKRLNSASLAVAAR